MEKVLEKEKIKFLLEPNEVQKRCINETKNGKYLVVAGPGTGKTFTVTRKIKNMIENQQVAPEKILCLTFSSTAAREMKNKIGEDYAVDVYTYHEFCLNIIKEFGFEFDIDEPIVASDTIKRNIIQDCIRELHVQNKLVYFNNEKENPYRFADEIYFDIEEIKKNRLTKEQFFYNIENNPMWKPRLENLPELIEQSYKKTEELLGKRASEKDSEEKKILTKLKDAQKKITDDLGKEKEKLENKIPKMYELWQLYELYNKKLHDDYGCIDFYDMINMVLEKFEDKNSKLLEEIAYKYEYILVDEYQDTNKSQNDIVFALSGYCPNIFVVGDDDQIIYTFQGASLDTLENYTDNFPEVQPVVLKENNRSTQTILDVTKVLADLQDEFDIYMKNVYEKEYPSEKLRLCSKDKFKAKLPQDNRQEPKRLVCPETSKMFGINNPVEYYSFENKEDERDYIVNRIKKIVTEKGEEIYPQIAVLTKSNKDLKDFETYLKINGIPVEITGGKNIFEISSVDVLLTYMQFLVDPAVYSDKILAYMALDVFDIAPKDYRILYEYKPRYKSLIDNINKLLAKGYDQQELKTELEKMLELSSDKKIVTLKDEIEALIKNKSVSLENEKTLKDFVDTYNYLKEFVTCENNLVKSIVEIGEKTGIFRKYLNPGLNQIENIKGLKKLLSEAENYSVQCKNNSVFSQFVEYLTTTTDSDIQIKLEQEETPLNAVQLSTYHSSKGREFEYVFMPFLTDRKFEKNSGEKKEHPIPLDFPKGLTYDDLSKKLEQERFLDYVKVLYVAMTRAKHTLVLSNIEVSGRGSQTCTWFVRKLINNEFLISDGLLVKPEAENFEELQKPVLYSDFDYEKEFSQYIQNHIPKSFSASSLNLYKKCPRQFFYGKVLGLNFDFSDKDNIFFGNAVHKAFEYAINYKRDNGQYPKSWQAYRVFLKSIDSSAHTNPLSAKKSARNSIFEKDKFYSVFVNLSDEYEITDSIAEMKLDYEQDSIKFNGFIDRIDEVTDKNGNKSYMIYDYKTGTNADGISPSGAHWDYFYQIAFYKYLFEKINSGKLVSRLCFLYPLLPDGESIVIPSKLSGAGMDEECEKVADEYIQIAKDINDMKFDCAQKCDPYCAYSKLCQMKLFEHQKA